MKAGAPMMRASNAICDTGQNRVVRNVLIVNYNNKLMCLLGVSFYAGIKYAMRVGIKLNFNHVFLSLQDQ